MSFDESNLIKLYQLARLDSYIPHSLDTHQLSRSVLETVKHAQLEKFLKEMKNVQTILAIELEDVHSKVTRDNRYADMYPIKHKQLQRFETAIKNMERIISDIVNSDS